MGIGLLVLVALWLVENFVREPQQFALVFLAGITNGSIYALVALGYTLVYGILELINFAHGDVFTWGAMVTYTVAVSWFGLDGSQTGFVTLRRSAARADLLGDLLRDAQHGDRARRLPAPTQRAHDSRR